MTVGERIVIYMMVTVILVAFIIMNPQMVRTFTVYAGPHPVTDCPGPTGQPDGDDPWGGCWPGPLTTGVPVGTSLSAYVGSCAVTTDGTILDGKIFDIDDCERLIIQASNVVIKNSRFDGTRVDLAEGSNPAWSFLLTDSDVNVGDRVTTGVGAEHYTMRRVEITGSSRSANCWDTCLVEDTYMHDQMDDETGLNHESAIRQGFRLTLRHNTVTCDAPEIAPDAGCSAAITGYGDFATVEQNFITRNRISSAIGYCAYGGNTAEKPFPNGNNNRWISNRWVKTGVGNLGVPQCGYYGPITSFDDTAPGNVWTDNTYLDGEVVPPAN